ncbi:fungal-specific transcription factor domain-containing protein [Lipomyces starkeyi]
MEKKISTVADVHVAKNSCYQCYAQKRSCDKILPCCSRCIKKGAKCDYTDYILAKRWSQAQSVTAYRLPQTLLGKDSIELRGYLDHSTFDYFSNIAAVQDLDTYLTARVYAMLHRAGLDAQAIVMLYLDSLHTWLPILHSQKLQESVTRLRTIPCAEFAVLILAICLATLPSAPSDCGRETQNSLYATCRSYFGLLQLHRNNRLETIQSGILLSVYELGRGMCSAAYLTIGASATMASVIGLHRPPRQDRIRSWIEVELRKRVWWGIVFLDRLVFQAESQSRRPMAVEYLRPDFELPIDDHVWNESDQWSWYPMQQTLVPMLPGIDAGYFAREAQATNLYDQVQHLLRREDGNSSRSYESEFWKLDKALRELASILFQNAGSWKINCSAIALVLTSFLTLHNVKLDSDAGRDSNPVGAHPPLSPSTSILAIKSTLKIIQTIVQDFVAEADMYSLPLAGVISLQKTALAAVELAKITGHDTAQTEILYIVAEALKLSGKRWGLAAKYLEDIEYA